MTVTWRRSPTASEAGGAVDTTVAGVEAGAGAAARELRGAGEALVVASEQRLTERIVHGLVVVEAAVEAFHMQRRQQTEQDEAAKALGGFQRHGLALQSRKRLLLLLAV